MKNLRLTGLLLMILKETQVIVSVLTLITILHLRSVHSLWFGVGSIIATGTAKILKRFIRQPRPVESSKSTYGMPSTHSSSISYFGIYLFLNYWLAESIAIQGSSLAYSGEGPLGQGRSLSSALPQEQASDIPFVHGDHSQRLKNQLIGLSFIFAAGCVCWSRVRLGHHTPLQVIVGALIGGGIGWIWFGIWSGFRLPSAMSGLLLDSPRRLINQLKPSTASFGSSPVYFDGVGDTVEMNFDRLSSLLVEAWKMRDGGLIWDSLARPALNLLGHRLGFQHDWVSSPIPQGARMF